VFVRVCVSQAQAICNVYSDCENVLHIFT